MMSNLGEIRPGEVEDFLQGQGIEYKKCKGGRELAIACPNGCDNDRRPSEEYHFYINAESGLYHCFKCDIKGNFYQFRKLIKGETMAESKNAADKTNKVAKKKSNRPVKNPETFVKNAQEALTSEGRQYLLGRGLSEETIAKYRLGYYTDCSGNEWFTIPIFNSGKCEAIKLRAAANNRSGSKYTHYGSGSKMTLLSKDELKSSRSDSIMICGGEFDKMIADQMNFGMPVITSTCGEKTLKPELIELLSGRRNYYICFDNDETGKNSTLALAEQLATANPYASIFKVPIPEELGDKADITDAYLHGISAKQLLNNKEFIAGVKPIDISKFAEMGVKEVADVLDLTIKKDVPTKVITLLGMLTAYTERSQLNIAFIARSASGKSYIAEEVSKFFPQADVHIYGKVTPTAFYYDDNFGEDADNSEQRVINLARQILIFTDQMDTRLLENLRPILSHDGGGKNRFLLTNKNSQGSNTAVQGYFRGYPVAIFCSANMRMDEQETSRCILLSPSTSQEKIQASLDLIQEKNADYRGFKQRIENNESQKQLKDRIIYVKNLNVEAVNVPMALDSQAALKKFANSEHKQPGWSRDYEKFNSLIKAFALLNAHNRHYEDHIIIAEQKDVEEATKLWKYISQSQDLGIPPQALEFYLSVILPAYKKKSEEQTTQGDKPLTQNDVYDYYWKTFGDRLNDTLFRKNYLPVLERAGLITIGKDPDDRRRQTITPQAFNLTKSEEDEDEDKDGDENEAEPELNSKQNRIPSTIVEIMGNVEEINDDNIPDFGETKNEQGGENVEDNHETAD